MGGRAARKRTKGNKGVGSSKLGNLEQTYFLNDPKVISLKKVVVLSVTFTILISWSPICILLMFLL